MELHNVLQEVKNIRWFEKSGTSSRQYHVIHSVFEAYDTWNESMLKTWEPQITKIEDLAGIKLGDEKIDEIFSVISCEIGDIIWEKWGEFIVRCQLEREAGLECEMTDMVKRDVSWAFIEKSLHMDGFFTELFEIYKSGYFPCAWDGDYPNGQAVVL